MSSHWDDYEEEKEDQSKGENQDKNSEKMTPQTNSRFFVASTLTPQPPKPSIIDHFGKWSSVTPEKEGCRCDWDMRTRTKIH